MKKDKVLCIATKKYLSKEEIEKRIEKKISEIWGQKYFLDNKAINYELENIKPEEPIEEYVVVYDHPHSDRENGQNETHYHKDSRYQSTLEDHFRVVIPLKENYYFTYKYLEKIHKREHSPTQVNLIKNSKLKHKCIYKGKCPHRGFDLTEVKPDNGTITCPLHGLKFNKQGKLL